MWGAGVCVRQHVYISLCVSRHLEQAWVWNWPPPRDSFPPGSWPTHTSANISLCVQLTTELAVFMSVSDSTLYLQFAFLEQYIWWVALLCIYIYSFHFLLLCSSQQLFRWRHKRRNDQPLVCPFSPFILFQIKILALCGADVCSDSLKENIYWTLSIFFYWLQ